MYEKVLEAIKNSSYDSFGIRRTCADEDYKVGDIARNSFYWDVENDLSSYQTEPEEMDGTSARTLLFDGGAQRYLPEAGGHQEDH